MSVINTGSLLAGEFHKVRYSQQSNIEMTMATNAQIYQTAELIKTFKSIVALLIVQ